MYGAERKRQVPSTCPALLLVAKNRKIRRVNLRDSSPPRDPRGGEQRELSKMSAKNHQLSLQSELLLVRTIKVKGILNYIMIFRWCPPLPC